MSDSSSRILPTRVEVADEAAADVTESGPAVQVRFHVAAGHHGQALRADLVARVFELPALHRHAALHATVPIGDTELIEQIGRRCDMVRVRAAGSTCLIDADLHSAGR
jgi:hypothetical protein